jgi:uncharacterized protein YqeY
MSAIKAKITEDMKNAMRSQNKERLATIRLIQSAIKQKEVDDRITLTDEHIIAILDKMQKQRRESISQFDAAGRDDLSSKEKAEIVIIQEYLPAQLSDAELTQLIDSAISEAGATSPKDMGKVMAIIKPKVQGRADVAAVSARVKEKLV